MYRLLINQFYVTSMTRTCEAEKGPGSILILLVFNVDFTSSLTVVLTGTNILPSSGIPSILNSVCSPFFISMVFLCLRFVLQTISVGSMLLPQYRITVLGSWVALPALYIWDTRYVVVMPLPTKTQFVPYPDASPPG